ncbi:MAG: hypothetical protein ACAH17_01360 [Candidatus Paceibacterota bacterium]
MTTTLAKKIIFLGVIVVVLAVLYLGKEFYNSYYEMGYRSDMQIDKVPVAGDVVR